MKLFIVFAVFAATASASLVASPAVGYNAHGLGVSGASLVSGVRTVGASYASPITTRVVSSLSTGLVSPIGYGAQQVTGLGQLSHVSGGLVSPIGYGGQHVSGLGQLQTVSTRLVAPVATLISAPIVGHIRTVTPIVNAIHLSQVAGRVVAPISTINVHSAPFVSNVLASNLYASHGSGLYASGHLGKKL